MSIKKHAGRIVSGVAVAVSLSWVVLAETAPKTGESGRVKVRATSAEAGRRDDKRVTVGPKDAAGIRTLRDALMEAYRRKSGEDFAALFTPDGEYVDAQDTAIRGREAIAAEFRAFFETHPGAEIEVQFDSMRTIAPQVAKVQGTTVFRSESSAGPARGRCHLICVRDGDEWRIANLREIEPTETASHHEQIKPLEWMVGDWISEGPQSDIQLACHWDATGNFLIREFSIRMAGRPPVSGTQRIGYDPLTRRLKAWTFDSDGGFSEGYFHNSESGWLLHSTGVTAGGELASAADHFQPVDGHRISWDITDRTIAGQRLPDVGQISIVRKPPSPGSLSTAGQPRPSK